MSTISDGRKGKGGNKAELLFNAGLVLGGAGGILAARAIADTSQNPCEESEDKKRCRKTSE